LVTVFYPVYNKYKVTTSYEYIQFRYGHKARLTISSLFILARLGWLSTVIYAPALALSLATGMPLWSTILILGILATVYTVLGGLPAVIWTDVPQFCIMIGGAVWVGISLCTQVPGGIGEIFIEARAQGNLTVLNWKMSLYTMSGFMVFITFFLQMMQDYGTDQVTVQRLMSIGSLKGIKRAVYFNALTDFFVIGLLLFIGLGLLAYYTSFPQHLGENIKGDSVFPHYIIHALPVGLTGLLLAAIFAAAMSSMDSGINSLATVILFDFIKPFTEKSRNDSNDLLTGRVFTLVLGVAATGMAFISSSIGHIIKAYTTYISLFSAPILAIFLLGMLFKKTSFRGWLAGCCVSIPATLWLQLSVKAHWVYYFPFSFIVCSTVGYGASLFLPNSTGESDCGN
jgi:SSS family transporter